MGIALCRHRSVCLIIFLVTMAQDESEVERGGWLQKGYIFSVENLAFFSSLSFLVILIAAPYSTQINFDFQCTPRAITCPCSNASTTSLADFEITCCILRERGQSLDPLAIICLIYDQSRTRAYRGQF
jgi:hypothetical protein